MEYQGRKIRSNGAQQGRAYSRLSLRADNRRSDPGIASLELGFAVTNIEVILRSEI